MDVFLKFLWLGRLGTLWAALLVGMPRVGPAADVPMPTEAPAITSARQILEWIQSPTLAFLPIRLEGVVTWVNAETNAIVFQDESGALKLELGDGRPVVVAGRKIRLEARGILGQGRMSWREWVLTASDRIRTLTWQTNTIYLASGRHPFRLDYFQDAASMALNVQVAGPDLPRQEIPPAWLVHPEPEGRWAEGLAYRAYSGAWHALPKFETLTSVKAGVAPDFDLRIAETNRHFGLQFEGALAVPRPGDYTFYIGSDDGSRLVLKPEPPRLTLSDPVAPPVPLGVFAGQEVSPEDDYRWAEARGELVWVGRSGRQLQLELKSERGLIPVEVTEAADAELPRFRNRAVRVRGAIQRLFLPGGGQGGIGLLTPSLKEVEWDQPFFAGASNDLAGGPHLLLTSIGQIRSLDSNALSHARVHLRAVVTLATGGLLSIHDGNQGMVCRLKTQQAFPRMGDYLQVDGRITPGGFGPAIFQAEQKTLGKSLLPTPLHPDWDQLMNGSLDQQYVELQGVVLQVASQALTLRTRSGDVVVQIPSAAVAELEALQSAVVNVCGVVWPEFKNRQILGVHLATDSCRQIQVLEPGPPDPFALPLKSVPELRYFDPDAAFAFHRVKVAGQVVGVGNDFSCLMAGTNGLRFTPKTPGGFEVGDVVEVTGYPEISGMVPLLREASVRRMGHQPLPPARVCATDELLEGANDSTRVQIEATLVSQSADRSGQILECQSGPQMIAVRLAAEHGRLTPLTAGSRLRLTGVCLGGGRTPFRSGKNESCTLELNRPEGVTVLALPPWWTAKHVARVAMGLLAGLLAAAGWIFFLRRQVRERTVQLESEIRQRERAEQQRLLETERSRIARDIHDELGGGLTQIALLSSLTALNAGDAGSVRAQAEKTGGVSRNLTRILDEIVWAVRPQNDNLESLVEYLGQMTRDMCEGSQIQCWFAIPPKVPPADILANVRHNLVLACREAVTNVLKHAQATELRMTVRLEPGRLVVEILDNGRGFNPTATNLNRSGLRNMRQRMHEIGGSFEFFPVPQGGTGIRLGLPVPGMKSAI